MLIEPILKWIRIQRVVDLMIIGDPFELKHRPYEFTLFYLYYLLKRFFTVN